MLHFDFVGTFFGVGHPLRLLKLALDPEALEFFAAAAVGAQAQVVDLLEGFWLLRELVWLRPGRVKALLGHKHLEERAFGRLERHHVAYVRIQVQDLMQVARIDIGVPLVEVVVVLDRRLLFFQLRYHFIHLGGNLLTC